MLISLLYTALGIAPLLAIDILISGTPGGYRGERAERRNRWAKRDARRRADRLARSIARNVKA